MSRVSTWALGLVLIVALLPALPAAAEPIGHDAFRRTWERTDLPVATLQVSRTWMWGPEAFSPVLLEDYAEAPGGRRQVQYFDKSRMEITDPAGDPAALWYVTNGLLARELLTGQMQVGDDQFIPRAPAEVNVAGDPDDPTAPTYATFTGLMAAAPVPAGGLITATVDRAGSVGADAGLAAFGVRAVDVGAPTGHTVASVFWDFMNSAGLVYRGGAYVHDRLADNPFYVTGYPLTEAYWTTVRVGGVPKRVLVQVFERRVLTYTPDNPAGWQVEAGNVGQHYYRWRYEQHDAPSPAPSPSPSPVPSPSPAPPAGFPDGTYRVGVDIQPGTYRNTDSSQLCYWERLSGFSGELDDIIANGLSLARVIVTIAPTDAGFSSEDCGRWVPDDTPLTASPTAPFGDGMYRVGRDIAPGLWRNSDSSDFCYWERLRGFSGELDDIIANEFSDTPQVVRIAPTDVGFAASRCGTWTRIGD
ncbi:MAG: hypothetical protein QJR03_12525 [Sphaerobacter sp.]|nr:hypothetical protein [Sphaerobacter sp.]